MAASIEWQMRLLLCMSPEVAPKGHAGAASQRPLSADERPASEATRLPLQSTRLICPAGLSGDFGIQPCRQKIFSSAFGRNSFIDSLSRAHKKGVSRSSRTLAKDAVDAGVQTGAGNCAGDGDKKARSPGSAKETVKPLRAGMPGVSGVSVVTNSRVFLRARLRVHRAPGIPTPSIGRRIFLQQLGRNACFDCTGAASFETSARARFSG